MKAYERLIKYTQYPTASNEASPTCPSTESQRTFAMALADEMREMGLSDVTVDANGYCYGTIPASPSSKSGKTLGLIAHMDVVADAPYENIKPQIIENYDGGIVTLKNGIQLDPQEFPFMRAYKGETLIVTDGNTLLGADDKAGIADILTFAEYCLAHPEYTHGRIRIGFTPDEEIGRGPDLFDVKGFDADFAYTLDGGAFGEVEYETFNAASATVRFKGRSIHPGSAKDKMINAARLAARFDSLLPENERPEYTEMYEGFFHLTGIEGEVENAVAHYILRDHDSDKLEKRKAAILSAVRYINDIYGEGTAAAEITDSYRNMKEALQDHMHLIENAAEAVRSMGGTPVSLPVRGGTDGCTLSYMGLPCPNIGTGSHNHHGRMEFAIAEEMDKCVELIKRIAAMYA